MTFNRYIFGLFFIGVVTLNINAVNDDFDFHCVESNCIPQGNFDSKLVFFTSSYFQYLGENPYDTKPGEYCFVDSTQFNDVKSYGLFINGKTCQDRDAVILSFNKDQINCKSPFLISFSIYEIDNCSFNKSNLNLNIAFNEQLVDFSAKRDDNHITVHSFINENEQDDFLLQIILNQRILEDGNDFIIDDISICPLSL